MIWRWIISVFHSTWNVLDNFTCKILHIWITDWTSFLFKKHNEMSFTHVSGISFFLITWQLYTLSTLLSDSFIVWRVSMKYDFPDIICDMLKTCTHYDWKKEDWRFFFNWKYNILLKWNSFKIIFYDITVINTCLSTVNVLFFNTKKYLYVKKIYIYKYILGDSIDWEPICSNVHVSMQFT